MKAHGIYILMISVHGLIRGVDPELGRDPDTGGPHTAHTLDPVPAVLINGPAGTDALRDGRLADVAPTLLALLGLPQPAEMTGIPLTRPAAARAAE